MNDGISQMMFWMGLFLILLISLACFCIAVIRRYSAIYRGNAEPSTRDLVTWVQHTEKTNKINMQTTVVTRNGRMDAEAQNINLLGAFISCQNPLPSGEVFDIILDLPDHSQLTLPAESIWNNSNVAEEKIITRGMSIRFRKMPDSDRQILTKALEELSITVLSPGTGSAESPGSEKAKQQMSRFLMIDIGAGTMDILYSDTGKDLYYKAVVKSPVQYIAEKAEGLSGNILTTGTEMGGGPVSDVLTKRTRHARVVMSASSAATLNHDLDKVRSRGIEIIDDAEAAKMQSDKQYSPLVLGDLQIDRIEEIIKGFGVSFSFDVVGICAQDHGVPTGGLSHLDYRHNIYKERLDKNPFPHALVYKADEVPSTFSRLTAIAQNAQMLPTNEVYVMDSGFAAILGASMDTAIGLKEKVLILDLATSHTLGAALVKEEIFGFFEYHTHDITLERLESLVRDLADGAISHDQILKEGGHGAYVRKAFGFENAEIILATGPKRKLLKRCRFPIIYGAPWGDNMMTGTVGLLEAIRRREGIKAISYL